MRQFHRRAFIGLTVVSLIAVGISVPVIAKDSIKKQISDVSVALERASQQVVLAKKNLHTTQAKLPAARQALATAQSREATARAAYNTAAAKLSAAHVAFATAQAKVAAKQAEIAALQIKVNQFARSIFEQGQTSQIEIVLQSKSPNDLTERIQAIKSVSQASSRSLQQLNLAKVQLKEDADAAASIEKQMRGLANSAQSTLNAAHQAAAQAASAKSSLDSLVSQESAALSRARHYMDAEQIELNKLIAEQIAINKISTSGSHGNGDPAGTSALIPLWPVPGWAAGSDPAQHVGPRILGDGRHSCHTGQDIPASTGAAIIAPGPGVVLSAGWNWGYGNLTLIDHGDGLVTAYAHQSRLYVSKGEQVTAGEHIGDVGNTGAFSRGAHLHFEVHVNGYNYDPMGWYGGSKRIVSCAPTRGF